MADAQGLAAADAHALAGFIDAEGCFGIRTTNNGRTWACFMTLALRDDDGDVLNDLARTTGLGRVNRKPATGTSRPQLTWSICSKTECLALVRILRRFPLRARKRRDFDIWAEAVDRWAAHMYGGGEDAALHGVMADARDRLRRARRYVDSPLPVRNGPERDVLAYLGGFFSGEGCFGLSDLSPRATVRVRRDDRPILDLFAQTFGVGLVREQPAYGGTNPTATWTICATAELAPAVRLFEDAQLRGRKRRELEVWREAALERAFAVVGGRPWNRARVARCAEELREMRVYRPPDIAPIDRGDDAQRTYAEVLRTFASESELLSSNAYVRVRARHPGWPTRNTIASAFGGWSAALVAAGLREAQRRLGHS